jgi:hypothetical protein
VENTVWAVSYVMPVIASWPLGTMFQVTGTAATHVSRTAPNAVGGGGARAPPPPPPPAAVIAVDLEGLSVEEAGQALGIPIGTVKSRCARGRAKLAVLLADLRNRPGPTSVQTQTPAARNTAPGVGESPEPMERGVR